MFKKAGACKYVYVCDRQIRIIQINFKLFIMMSSHLMMVAVSMAESTNTGVAIVMAMTVSLVSDIMVSDVVVSDIVMVMRMHWHGYWNWSFMHYRDVFLVHDWIRLGNVNGHCYWPFDGYSVWAIDGHLYAQFTVENQLENVQLFVIIGQH